MALDKYHQDIEVGDYIISSSLEFYKIIGETPAHWRVVNYQINPQYTPNYSISSTLLLKKKHFTYLKFTPDFSKEIFEKIRKCEEKSLNLPQS